MPRGALDGSVPSRLSVRAYTVRPPMSRRWHRAPIDPPAQRDPVRPGIGRGSDADACASSRWVADTLLPLVGATPAQAARWASETLRRGRAEVRDVGLANVAAVALPGDTRSERDRRRVATHEAGQPRGDVTGVPGRRRVV